MKQHYILLPGTSESEVEAEPIEKKPTRRSLTSIKGTSMPIVVEMDTVVEDGALDQLPDLSSDENSGDQDYQPPAKAGRSPGKRRGAPKGLILMSFMWISVKSKEKSLKVK